MAFNGAIKLVIQCVETTLLLSAVAVSRLVAILMAVLTVVLVAPDVIAGPSSNQLANAYPHQENKNEPVYRNAVPGGFREYVPAQTLRRYGNPNSVFLRSHVALLYDERDKENILQRGIDRKMEIASLTKLMTAMVVVDASQPMDELITIEKADKDTIRYSKSRLKFGTTLRRYDMLLLALAASENRAAFALARTYPGGTRAFVEAMNEKAQFLGLRHTRFADSAGLKNGNVSTATDLVKMVNVASKYSLIRDLTTTSSDVVIDENTGKEIKFKNTNRLVRKSDWDILLSKTGFTSDAGNCLVMKLTIGDRPLILVLLNSWGKYSKYGDTNRIRKWLLNAENNLRGSSKF